MGIELPFLGLLLSLAFIAITGVYPGGIIVPSYLVLFLDQPERIVGTLGAALLTWLAYRVVSRWLILFGRRRFTFLILVGGAWALVWRAALPSLFPASVEFAVIGWVIPGLIANHFERQGVLLTSSALVLVTVLLGWAGRIWLLG
ncbi:MAG: poly-gamma-glutamate biosynthesis protein PgsC [Longimicrobiales bacterium]